jgi:uncharacterized membrane protein YhaH (DUF805 family)
MALADVNWDAGTLLVFLLIPAVFIVAVMVGFGLFLRLAGDRAIEWEEIPEDEGTPKDTARTWWGNPIVWLAVCAVLVVLGVFVAPHFLGGTFLFLPFVWIGGRRWRPRPRTRPRRAEERPREPWG